MKRIRMDIQQSVPQLALIQYRFQHRKCPHHFGVLVFRMFNQNGRVEKWLDERWWSSHLCFQNLVSARFSSQIITGLGDQETFRIMNPASLNLLINLPLARKNKRIDESPFYNTRMNDIETDINPIRHSCVTWLYLNMVGRCLTWHISLVRLPLLCRFGKALIFLKRSRIIKNF